MNYDLNMSPNWIYEAAILLSERDSDRTADLIENYSSFGISKEEMIERLSKYIEYKEAILPEIIPIFEEYPYLIKYFDNLHPSTDDYLPAAPTLAGCLGNAMDEMPSKEEIDLLVNDFIIDTISGFSERISSSKVINSLEELLSYMDDEDVNDETKLLLIDIYRNRYKVLNGLVDLLQACAPVCQEYFYILQDDFQKAVELVSDRENINKLLNMDGSININLNENVAAFLSLSNFNGLSLTEGIDGFLMYVGIYFCDYLKLKTENRFSDTKLINDLKALGDATRLKIVHLLAKEKMYVQELANELELTPATISHHINTLLKSELITITLDTERPKTIYYQLNPGKIYSLGSTVQGLVDYKEV